MERLLLAGLTCIGLVSLSACTAIPVNRLSAGTSMITSGGSTGKWQEIPMSTIQLKDPVFMVTYITWEPVDESAGSHDATWAWYRDGKVVYRCASGTLPFKKTPFRLWCKTQAAGLGVGHFRVELSVDGVTVSTKEFDIVEATAGEPQASASYASEPGPDVKTVDSPQVPKGMLLAHCPNAIQVAKDIGFPPSAIEAGLHEGSATLAIVLAPSGSLRSIRVVTSTDRSFDQAAIDAAARLRCNGDGLRQDTEIRWEMTYKAK